jgi:fructose-bisphosphate aldolase class I
MAHENHTKLYATIDHLMDEGKGILAADESTKNANGRLAALQLPATEQTRRDWREVLLCTPNLEDFISGVILYDETIRQKTSQGISFAQHLVKLGIIPGIKVDAGLVELTNFPDETITEGLDHLDARLKEYAGLGARFAKWRAAFAVGPNTPTEAAIHANGNAFGRYASLCQANGIVPIIEPEVLHQGSHTIAQAEAVTTRVLATTIDIVKAYKVDLRGVIIKTSFVLAGADNAQQSPPTEVAAATLRALKAAVPEEVGAVVFLSGGQSPQEATRNLNAVAQLGKQAWPITYSFSRAVQDPVMKAWQGLAKNTLSAQRIFYHRLACNSAARAASYHTSMEIFESKK